MRQFEFGAVSLNSGPCTSNPEFNFGFENLGFEVHGPEFKPTLSETRLLQIRVLFSAVEGKENL